MAASAEMQWEPLLSAARDLGSDHVSLVGSAVLKPLSTVSDVDVHLVIPHMDRFAFAALGVAADLTIRAVAAQSGRPSRVELRHGPFKPAPSPTRELQLHLLLDDEASAERLPCALIAQRAATGLLLAGKPLVGKRIECDSAAMWIQEARVELKRWRNALAAREIAFRHWTFDPAPRFVEARSAAETSWDLSCLLRGAAKSSDLFYRAASWATSRSPLLAEFGEEPAWEPLFNCWPEVRDRAISIIDQRLKDLSRMTER